MTFEDPRDCQEANEKMSGFEWKDKRLRVDYDAGVKKKQDLGFIRTGGRDY